MTFYDNNDDTLIRIQGERVLLVLFSHGSPGSILLALEVRIDLLEHATCNLIYVSIYYMIYILGPIHLTLEVFFILVVLLFALEK